MKKVLILVTIIPLLVGCAVRTREFSQFYTGNSSNVSRLVILNGSNGERREVIDQKEIQAFFDMLETLSFMMQKDQSPRANYLYWVDIYQNGASSLRLTFTEDTARVKGVYYLLDNNVKGELEQLFAAGR